MKTCGTLVNIPLCRFQSQGEVFSPDGGCVAMRTVVSCAEQRPLLWCKEEAQNPLRSALLD